MPTMLVIDDNTSNRALARQTLEDEGYRVVVAGDGTTGIAAFERERPEGILLDIQMPGMDGTAVCRTIRAMPGGARVAIVFVTAHHDVDTFDSSIAVGGDDFVTKPYRPSELAARVQTALQLRRVAHERDDVTEMLKHQRDSLQRIEIQIRDANERLITATVQADELAEAADKARAVAALNADRFRTLVRMSSALVWRADADGQIEFDRETWRGFTGSNVAPGQWGWLDAVHPEDRPRVRAAWSQAVTSSCPYSCLHRIRNHELGYAWVLARAAPIVTAAGVDEWIGMSTDVTDRIRLDDARERFIGILGHDLRTPLNAITMGIELLGALPKPQRDVVARMGTSARRMEAMISDILDFARGRLGGGIPIARRSTDLGTISEGVVKEIKLAHPARQIHFDAVGELRGQWDPERVEQALSNLLGNAIKHGVGAVTVTVRDEGAVVVTTVHNRGTPIPIALIPTLFDPFTGTSHGGQPASAQGVGLGLYIASEIAHAHGATITVSSAVEDGTIFEIRWPRSR